MKAKKSQANRSQGETKPTTSKSNQRYLILTYMANENKFHFPLSLSPVDLALGVEELKEIYNELRTELEAARAAALNDTAKSENSMSINYEKKTKNSLHHASKLK